MSSLFLTLNAQDSKGSSLFSVTSSTLHSGGSANVDLVDGIKSPDFSLYENDLQKRPLTQACPTVVWEVVYSEDERKLARDVGRHVACSLGRVRLAIGVKIEHECGVKGEPRKLKKVTCAFWEADYVEEFATLEESGSRLNYITRCNGSTDDDDNGSTQPAATKFSCVSKVRGKYVKFFVSQKKLYGKLCSNILVSELMFIFFYRYYS
jgi:hypothetical protein